MDTFSAFARGAAARARGAELMVFDWEKAARLIAERKPVVARAGLSGDWEWTGDVIWENGEPRTDAHAYLASLWATPELDIDGEIIACFVMQSTRPQWNSGTLWPPEAMSIVGARAASEE